MSAVDPSAAVLAIAQAGGIATWAQLRPVVSRRRLARLVAAGLVVSVARGRYALPGLDEARVASQRTSGVVSHRSAALTHGWGVRTAPPQPELVLPRRRHLRPAQRRGVVLRWRDLADVDVIDGWLTGELRTVLDCARDLPLTEALPVADSALRAGAVTQDELREAAGGLPRTGRTRACLVLEHASALAANPFESSLRALAIEAVGPCFVPQVPVRLRDGAVVRPDLVCPTLRLVLEADSHEFHTSRSQLRRDCWRYDELTLAGWRVLRFSWEHVMHESDWVVDVLRTATA